MVSRAERGLVAGLLNVFLNKFLIGERLRKMKALQAVYAIFPQNFRKLMCFHSFRADIRMEEVREDFETLYEFLVLFTIGKVLNKASVDLDRFDLNVLQQANGREACAEIVNGEFDAHIAQFPNHMLQPLYIQHPAALRDFQTEILSGEAGLAQQTGDRMDEIVPLYLRIRQIYVQNKVG